MASRSGYKGIVGVRVLCLLWCACFTILVAGTVTSPASTTPSRGFITQEPEYLFVDQSGLGIMAQFGLMKNAVLALASSALVKGQSPTPTTSNLADGLGSTAMSMTGEVATATVNGTPTTYSVAFTVPASAENGPNILPNIKNSSAVQAQQACPGYTASGVEKTDTGFTATLNLAGEPVSTPRHSCMGRRRLTLHSATSTVQTSKP